MSKLDEYEKATKAGKTDPPPRTGVGPYPEPPVRPRPQPPAPDNGEREPAQPSPPPPDPDARHPEQPPRQPPRDDSRDDTDIGRSDSRGYWYLVAAVVASLLLHLYLVWSPRVSYSVEPPDLSPILTALSTLKDMVAKIPTDRMSTVQPVVECPDKKCPVCPDARPEFTRLRRQVADLQGKLEWVRKLERQCRMQQRKPIHPIRVRDDSARALERHYQMRENFLREWIKGGCKADVYFKTQIN